MTVPEAGAALGLSASAAYRAAERGEIPTLRVGRRLVALVAPLRRQLGLDPPTTDA
jgi:excisionase family DNA binding protein